MIHIPIPSSQNYLETVFLTYVLSLVVLPVALPSLYSIGLFHFHPILVSLFVGLSSQPGLYDIRIYPNAFLVYQN